MGLSVQSADKRPRCPWCGQPMRNLCSGGNDKFYCINDDCQTEFVKITTKADWVLKRQRQEARRREELQEAIKTRTSYPPPVQVQRAP